MVLNKYFKKVDVPIRIIQSYIVPETFHSRHNAISRTYLYRILVKKYHNHIRAGKHSAYIPIEELGRCEFIKYVALKQSRDDILHKMFF